MTAPIVLLTYALLVATIGSWALQHAGWLQRSPLTGILGWQALTASVVLAVILAGTAPAVPTLPVTMNLADWLHACALALKAHYATPGGAVTATAGATFAAAVIARVGYCLAIGWSGALRRRKEQRHGLDLIAHRHAVASVWVVQHNTPAVYCLPGRRGAIVLTTGAIDILDDSEVAAVLAHERAHLRARHDLILTAASALRAAFPFVPLFATAYEQLARLVEMHADDAALKDSDRRVLATALVALAAATHPAGTLAAGGEAALARVRRLASPIEPLGIAGSALAVTAALTVLVLPLLIAAAPAAVAAAIDYCPVGFPA